ncbi:MAG: TauD/TfdA family dioxygenase [Alphaproteobacteria bacterium]|nr:TauD/TfdA family dioxygenase [Alphaproteobacteria bacterium]
MVDLNSIREPGRRAPAVPREPVLDPACWTAEEMRAGAAYLFHLTPTHVDELAAAIVSVEDAAVPIMDISRNGFPLPSLGGDLSDLRREILDGRGFVQIRGFPVDRFDAAQCAIAFWGLSMYLGESVASQNAKGHVLGHICDIGQTVANPNQRGPYSHDTIPFHVDCCDIVGLMCLHPSKSGGESSLSSSVAVYNAVVERRPDLLGALLEPYYRDRRGEVPPGMPPWYKIPVFNFNEGYLSTNIEPTYMGSADRHDGVPPMTPQQREALTLVQDLAAELRLDIAFERGDMQFLNNHVIMHSRRAFEDHAEQSGRRHLLRIWLLNKGCRPLPEAYFARHGDPAVVAWPGGIVGPDTVLNAPLKAFDT